MRKKNINTQSAQSLISNTTIPNTSPIYVPTQNYLQSQFEKTGIKTQINHSEPCMLTGNNNYGNKSAAQLDKMQSFMTDLYNRRKHNNIQKNSSRSNLNTSTISNLSESTLKLPSIGSSMSSLDDQSKLSQQIKKIQSKIRQLKYQRTMVNNQQNQMNMIRPFVQIQNQNMANMQMMMLMMQQNKQPPHQCCEGNNKIQYVPFPSYGPGRGKYSNNIEQEEEEDYSEDQRSMTKTKKKKAFEKKNYKLPKKTYNFKKIRKFRIAVIAVYFSLIFPRFASRFTRKRYQLHSQKYFSDKQSHQQKMALIFFDQISVVNCFLVGKTVQQFRKQKQIRRVTKTKTAKLVISQQYGGQKSYQIYLGDVQLFLLQFLKKFHELIQDGGLQETIRQLGVGNMPNSFPIDLNYLLQQLYRLTFHPTKLYIKVSQIHSKSLILSLLFVKLLIFDYLFIIRQDLQWKKRLLKQNGLRKDQMIESQMVATQMYISGVLLHRYCMQLIEQMVQNQNGNIQQMNSQNIPIPLQVITYDNSQDGDTENQESSSTIGKEKQIKAFNRFQKIKASGGNKLDLEMYRQIPLYKFQYIKNLQQFESLISEIQNKSDHKTEVKDKIMDILDDIYERIIESRKVQYKRIKDDLLFQQKNMVSKKIGTTSMNFDMGKRSVKQKNYIRDMMKLIKDNRKKQSLGISDEEDEQQNEDQEISKVASNAISSKQASDRSSLKSQNLKANRKKR